MIISDYHPESVTLSQGHLKKYGNIVGRRGDIVVPEELIWSYVTQLANAIRSIHAAGAAARRIEASKILITDENRIRYNGQPLADILDFSSHSLIELQTRDMEALGTLVIWLVTLQTSNRNVKQLFAAYQPRITELVEWLLDPSQQRTADCFMEKISHNVIDSFDKSLGADDVLQSHLGRELENSRIARLMMKLSILNERPEYEDDPLWKEYGPRGSIKLFRDYVFHQVDAQGRPVTNMGHMIAALNKLDVGADENVTLTTRDGKTVIIVTYREMKQLIEGAFVDVMRRSQS